MPETIMEQKKKMLKIAVIDDEPLLREFFDRFLKKEGHEVSEFKDGEEFLSLLDGKVFDLVFVDYKMPRMDGDEVIGKIKERNPNVHVVFMSANLELIDPKELRNYKHIEAFVAKPIDMDQVRGFLATL